MIHSQLLAASTAIQNKVHFSSSSATFQEIKEAIGEKPAQRYLDKLGLEKLEAIGLTFSERTLPQLPQWITTVGQYLPLNLFFKPGEKLPGLNTGARVNLRESAVIELELEKQVKKQRRVLVERA